MAFAIKSHILVDIYCRNLQNSNFATLNKTEIRNRMSTRDVISTHYASGVMCACIYIRRGLSVLLIRFEAAKARVLDKLMQWPALFYGLIRK